MTNEQFEIELPNAMKTATGPVKRILSRFTRIEAEKDVLQIAAMKAWKHLSEFRETCKFSTWFTRIAMNEAGMYVRRNWRTTESLDALYEWYAPGEDDGKAFSNAFLRRNAFLDAITEKRPTPEEQTINNEKMSRLTQEILKLNPMKRRDILLYTLGKKREGVGYTAQKVNRWKGVQILKEKLGVLCTS